MVKQGHRAVVVYCVGRNDVQSVVAAAHIDAKYAQAVDSAMNVGVEFVSLFVNFDDSGDIVII